jgi:hypothetical protein
MALDNYQQQQGFHGLSYIDGKGNQHRLTFHVELDAQKDVVQLKFVYGGRSQVIELERPLAERIFRVISRAIFNGGRVL